MMVTGLIYLVICLLWALAGVMWHYGKKNESEQREDKTMVTLLVLAGIIIFIISLIRECK